jgi:hypothetical protein
LIAELCVRDTFQFTEDSSGLVIAGFGEKEFYPRLVSYTVEMVIEDHVKRSDADPARIAADSSAIVAAFAQREMVQAFLHGIAPAYIEELGKALKSVFDRYPNSVADALKLSAVTKKKLVKELRAATPTLISTILRQLDTESYRNTARPILEGVQNLPLDELALMAESLVNLTSFKRRISLDMETVGGPIDVAVLSKGEGFIWIKRKHYFDAQQNPHFIQHYYN